MDGLFYCLIMLHLSIFLSGRGSNFIAIHKAIVNGYLDADIRLVVSSSSTAQALDYAAGNGMASLVENNAERQHAGYGKKLLSDLECAGVDFIALAGYLKLLPPEIVRAYPNRILNVHPALLPAFGGKGMYGHFVHEAVLASGAKYSGATVHLVDEEYDRGPIVLQEAISVADDDTPESLAARVLQLEHTLYPKALQAFAENRVTVNGRRTFFR